jgi:TPR repeat protein
MADDLADANKALDSKSYAQAVQLFSKLASAGNAEAQLRLGEMYWYGEGVPLDRAKGDALFAQAAAAGNPEASAARLLTGKRAQRAADIAHWTSGYDGADLTAGKYNCAAPTIPEVSKTNSEINATKDAVTAWRACREGFAKNMNSVLPPGKAIPPAVAEVMSEPETQQAKMHLDKVYAAVLNKVKASDAPVLAQREKWEAATVAFVSEQNKITETRERESKLRFEETERARLNGAALSHVGVSGGR